MSLTRSEKRELSKLVLWMVVAVLVGTALLRGCDAAKSWLDYQKYRVEQSLGLGTQ